MAIRRRLKSLRGHMRRDKLAIYYKRIVSGPMGIVDTVIPEIGPVDIDLISRYREFTVTGVERQWALISAVRYLNAAGIEGDIVECGVFRGGNMMLAKELCRDIPVDRRFYLFDTFSGMSEPTDDDVSPVERPARETYS